MGYEYDVEENGDYRCKIVLDESPEPPYDDSQSPILRLDLRYPQHATFVDSGSMRPHEEDDYIINAINHWQTKPSDSDWPLFEKYLRAFWGVTQIETFSSNDYWYITYDSVPWRRAIGFDGTVAPLDGGQGTATLTEYENWVNGEVYGWIVEKKVTWRRVDTTTDDPAYLETMTKWEHVDSCFGYYGDDNYLRDSAKEAMRNAMENSEE